MALLSKSLRGGSGWIAISIMALLLIVLAGCGGSGPVTVPTPTPSTLQFTTFDLKLPPEALNAPMVGPLPLDTPMHIRIAFKPNQAVLDQVKKRKPGQNQNLETLANQIGISDATYRKIKQILGVSDASLTLNKLHTDLTIDTKAQTAALLFQVQFVVHQLKDRTFYAPTTNPKVPTFLAPSILAITGLDNYSPPAANGHTLLEHQFQTQHVRHHPGADCTFSFSVPAPTPADIAHAYGYDQLLQQGLHGENITVNLVEIEGFNQNDVQNYGQCVNFQGDLKVVNVGPPPDPAKAVGETALDIEMLMGLAPSVKIVDYQADGGSWSNIEDDLQKLIDDNTQKSPNGSIVSISLGGAETPLTPDEVASVDQKLQLLTQAEHMMIFVASGDCGAFGDRNFGDLSVSFPATDTNVVAVGGTELSLDADHNRRKEVVWSDRSDRSKCTNQWGSGGGLSTRFKQPDWQTGTGVNNQDSNGFRQVPDVAAVAFHLPIYLQGQWTAVDGTSAATPIWAAGFALANEGVLQQTNTFFFGPDTFYAVANTSNGATPYYDVTQGDNLHFSATNGWDYATGFGTPNLPDFYKTLLTLAKQS